MKKWIVPQSLKVGFFWFSLVLLMSLVFLQVKKRQLYERLHADSVMRAQDDTPKHAPLSPLLAQYSGKWVLLHFWATWCPPCRTEMPSIEVLNRELGNELIILAVSVDENPNDVDKFFAGQKPSMKLIWDKGQELSSLFNVVKYPETFLIAPDGVIRARFKGPREWDSKASLQYLRGILAGKQSPLSHN